MAEEGVAEDTYRRKGYAGFEHAENYRFSGHHDGAAG
jgi:hypothetical protein